MQRNFIDGQFLGKNYISDLVMHIDGDKSVADNGLAARVDIPKDSLLAVFGGYAITHETYKNLPDDLYDRDLAIQITQDLFLGPIKGSDVDDGDYVNHSCDPNCGILGLRYLVAMRDIKKSEELFFDYAMSDSFGIPDMDCLCNTDNCRKVIRHTDWKLPELQKKYGLYFGEHILKKILKRPDLYFHEERIDTEQHLRNTHILLANPEQYYTGI